MIATRARRVEPTIDEGVAGLPLPLGRRVVLPGRGTTFVREVEGPPGAPVLLLVHGWIASGGLNWFQCFGPLSEHFRVLAPDLRGHGRGIRSRRRFRLADCADDLAVMLDELEVPSAIVVGYSLGGPVAQLLWRRHPEKVDGLVLCATSHFMMPGQHAAVMFASMMGVLAGTTKVGQWATRVPARRVREMVPVPPASRPSSLQAWARHEMQRHDVRMLLEAGQALGTFSSRRWIGKVDVPTAVVVTTQDKAQTPINQMLMALAIPGATVHRLDDGHVGCARPAFAPVLVAACDDVAERAAAARRIVAPIR